MYIAFLYQTETKQRKVILDTHALSIASYSVYWTLVSYIGPLE
ncbi:unnamed protein product, partial [marine sediment metagenome]